MQNNKKPQQMIKKITTKSEFVQVLEEYLLHFIKKHHFIGDTILVTHKSNLNVKPKYSGLYDFWVKIPIFDVIDENSELCNSFKKNKFEFSHLEALCDNLVDKGYLKKEQISSNSKDTTIINYIVTTKSFLESSQINTIFYAMEFNNQTTKDFFNKLKNKIKEKLPFFEVIMLADEQTKLNFSTNINNRIQNDIKMCRFFIADLTSKDNNHKYLNSNVMYETGLAEAYNKEIIYIAYKDSFNVPENLPFDIRNHSVNYYSNEPLEQEALIEKIIESMKSSLNANN